METTITIDCTETDNSAWSNCLGEPCVSLQQDGKTVKLLRVTALQSVIDEAVQKAEEKNKD